jgi:hypothetical protein
VLVDLLSLYLVGGIVGLLFGPMTVGTAAFQSQIMVVSADQRPLADYSESGSQGCAMGDSGSFSLTMFGWGLAVGARLRLPDELGRPSDFRVGQGGLSPRRSLRYTTLTPHSSRQTQAQRMRFVKLTT